MAHPTFYSIAILCRIISAEVTTYNIERLSGSSVLLPGLEPGMVEFKDDMIHELKKVDGDPEWLAQYHGGPVVHNTYSSRGHFFHENKSFLLEDLRKTDSGVYEQKVNGVTWIRVFLGVFDPVPKPTLSRQNNVEDCLVHLQCLHSGEGHYNITFLKIEEPVDGNITKSPESSVLHLDGTDLQHRGTYTCNISYHISWKISNEVLVGPQGIEEEQVPFYITVAGLSICMVYVITQVLWKMKKLNNYKDVKNILFMARHICGVLLECAVLFLLGYYGYCFMEEWRSLIGGMVFFFVIVMVRISWCCLVRCNSSMGWIITAEKSLLVTDLLLVPGLFMVELVLNYQDDDLCGMKMQTRWTIYFYLWITMVAIILAVCLYRPCRKSEGPQKVPLVEASESNGVLEENSDPNESQERSNNDSSVNNGRETEEGHSEGGATDSEEMTEEEDSTQDTSRHNGCQDNMEDKEDKEGVTEMQLLDNESEDGILLQAETCIE